MTIFPVPANKSQTYGVAHIKAITLLEKHAIKSAGLISFPECRRVLSWLYHFDRCEVFAFLVELEAKGMCQIIPYRGVKIGIRRDNDRR
jgi:hypothetical protein